MRFEIIVSLVATMIISAILTPPFVRKLAFRVGAVDTPNNRRVNKVPMPTIGGLAIFIAFTFSTMVLLRNQMPTKTLWGIFGGEVIIILTGIVDDIFELKPRQKVLGISLAALWVYFFAGGSNDFHYPTIYYGAVGMAKFATYVVMDFSDY